MTTGSHTPSAGATGSSSAALPTAVTTGSHAVATDVAMEAMENRVRGDVQEMTAERNTMGVFGSGSSSASTTHLKSAQCTAHASSSQTLRRVARGFVDMELSTEQSKL